MTGKGTILVVEDTAESLMMLTDLLTAEGYQVRPADSGELALASVSADPPELVLLDIRMPGMDGFEVCRRLKDRPESREIPVIFISALTATADRVQGLKLGAVDFVSKPFQKEELLARVATHLELRRLRLRLEQQVAERTAELRIANGRLQAELNERIRAEQALRESEDLFRNLADAAPVVIWLKDRNEKLVFCNQYATTITGRTRDELVGGQWKALMHPEDRDRNSVALAPSYERQTSVRREYRLLSADGQYRWMLETATPRFLAAGAFEGYAGVSIDITDLKRDQDQLVAEQKLESVGVLAAGVAHRFNNLLGSIIGEADLALLDLPEESPARGCVERINAIAVRAAEIVSLLMAYAGAADSAELVPVQLRRIINETLQLVNVNLPKKIALEVNLPDEIVPVSGRASQLRQVVMSLVTNGIESIVNKEGAVRLTVSRAEIDAERSPRLPADLPAGSYVRLEVSDTGCGMSEEMQKRVFDPFYSSKFLGRGLGLSAVQGIVRGHGGAITMRSAPGAGSTFEVFLPCAEPVEGETASAASAAWHAGRA